MAQAVSTARPFRLLVKGPYALFARPEMKVERVSYEIMTPSAARGVLEAILWKPAMRWVVVRIDRLQPVRFAQIRRNEVAIKASVERAMIVVDDPNVRQQRAAMVLVDPAYVIYARIALTDKAGLEDSLPKFKAIFTRRAAAGQCFQQPCLGAREFAAEFRLLTDDDPEPVPAEGADANPDLGWIFYDFDWRSRPPTARFFNATLDGVSLHVPPPESVELRA